jgi:hypothetical protein
MVRAFNINGADFDARCVLMLDVTCQTLQSDPDLRLCEGLRLIEATRTAVARLAPQSLELFEETVLPQMRSMLMERFGVSELSSHSVN